MKKLHQTLSMGLACLALAAAAGEMSLIRDAATGCAIWNPNPHPHETIVWRGDIKNGKAHGYGIAVWYRHGRETERAEGHWHKGRLDGYAVWTHANDTVYEGEWHAGQKSGHGVYTWPDGMSFLGQYQKDKRGDGRTFYPAGTPRRPYVTTTVRDHVHSAQDAAIQARKAAKRARIENPPPTTKTTEAAPTPSINANNIPAPEPQQPPKPNDPPPDMK